MTNSTQPGEEHMPEWGMSPEYHWEYRAPPYRGVLVAARTAGNGRTKAYEAYIETPEGTYQAPHLFSGMDAAKQWVEHEIWRISGQHPQRRATD